MSSAGTDFCEHLHAVRIMFILDQARNPKITKNLGPVVQSIVSLTSSLRGQLVKCFATQ